jgi:hypothetical protein
MRRTAWFYLSVVLACCVFVLPAFAEGKDAQIKIGGAIIVEAKADPGAGLAPLALKTDKGEFQLLDNAIAKKMQKYVGGKADVTGRIREVGGKKVFEPYLFERMDPTGKKPRRLPS